MGNNVFIRVFDNIESYVCRSLLAFFVVLLFAQILMREFFDFSLSWSEELATYLFVWFVFFGASYAAKLGAHNRVTFQFNLLPGRRFRGSRRSRTSSGSGSMSTSST